MGMAASQARWLALTARKTNVEYEGQQINQARTALANKSANTFNELLALEVPTAPSTQDYTTIEYTYKDGTIEETIDTMTQLTNDPDYNYLVTHYHYSDVYTGVYNRLTNPQVLIGTNGVKNITERTAITESGGTYYINGATVSAFDESNQNQLDTYYALLENYPELAQSKTNLMTYNGTDGEIHFTLSDELAGTGAVSNYYTKENVPKYVGNAIITNYDPTDTTQKAAYEQICKDNPNTDFAKAPVTDIYKWTFQGEVRYGCLSDMQTSYNSAPDKSKPTENQTKLPYYVAKDLETKIEQQQKAIVDIGSDGRIQSIRYEDSSATYAVSTSTKTDDNAYQDAMNQYHYDMEVYEKKIADINAKTEKIQEQDRTLELRLRQLDTEQEALQTEMEAVQKVIQKNIESTFKTFES